MKTRGALFLVLVAGLVLSLGPASAQGPEQAVPPGYYLGADLSYVNEMDDCGAVFRVGGEPRDPYQIFADYGANLVRIRLWHTPDWTDYSTLEDVIRSLRRAQALGMDVLLDFHYSDTWADPGKQIIPAAWADITDLDSLGQALYQYTYDVLTELDSLGLMPEIVQVGNEINTEILRPEGTSGYPIDWDRNAFLINRAIQAVRDAGAAASEAPRVMLHIAKPEEVEGWLLAAERAGVTDYDLIGISYYPGWSNHSVETVGNVVRQLHYKFGADVMIVETAYPWTLDGADDHAGNNLGADFLSEDYPATPEGQRQFLTDLAQSVFAGGGVGVIYWEPAWVATDCFTLWGQGSHWDNATFFDFHEDNEILPGIEFLQYPYEYPVEVALSFRFDTGDLPETIYFWPHFTGQGRRLTRLPLSDGAYSLNARLLPGTEIQYQFYGAPPASAESALLPPACQNAESYAVATIPTENVTLQHTESRCPGL